MKNRTSRSLTSKSLSSLFSSRWFDEIEYKLTAEIGLVPVRFSRPLATRFSVPVEKLPIPKHLEPLITTNKSWAQATEASPPIKTESMLPLLFKSNYLGLPMPRKSYFEPPNSPTTLTRKYFLSMKGRITNFRSI